MSNSNWETPSIIELQNISKSLANQISFEDLALKYCKKVRSVNSATFTHQCICPNPHHKGGNEQNPAFYFSDTNKFYKCLACQISGDIFDFLTLVEGISWHDAVMTVYNKSSHEFLTGENNNIDIVNLLFDLNLDISNTIRKYLITQKDTSKYELECKWAESLFKRVDETFVKFANSEPAPAPLAVKAFHTQILMELARRSY